MDHQKLLCRTYRVRDTFDTLCCCEYPFCNQHIQAVANSSLYDYIPLNTDAVGTCVEGTYRFNRMTVWNFTDDVLPFPVCSLRINVENIQDPRSQRVHSVISIDLEMGCGFDMGPDDLLIYTSNDTVEYCCRGHRCNQKLFLNFGLELLINSMFADHEYEYRQRFTHEFRKHSVLMSETESYYEEFTISAMISILVAFTITGIVFLIIAFRIFEPKSIVAVPESDEDEGLY
ncbi:unnamed protein product [Caenorhabditis bovis]|uniref:Uncharacterized protein n=1 Tax=Caenorhabditis bovis TaxID=2654633 RepID=A0A8S1F0U8_9PELO|nr:unnamed protein product [Caenorhabditis bovis]